MQLCDGLSKSSIIPEVPSEISAIYDSTYAVNLTWKAQAEAIYLLQFSLNSSFDKDNEIVRFVLHKFLFYR